MSMESLYAKTRAGVLVCLLLGSMIAFCGLPAGASGLSVNYTQEIVEDVHYYHAFQLGNTFEFGPFIWLESAVGLGDLLDFEHSVFALDLGVYRHLAKFPDYALGLGYSYLYDRRSYFSEQGGKLKEHELAFKLLGSTHFGNTEVAAELSYTPLGTYKYMNDLPGSFRAVRFTLSAAIPFGEHWNLSLKTMQGHQSYTEERKSTAMYQLGLQYMFD